VARTEFIFGGSFNYAEQQSESAEQQKSKSEQESKQ